jgi:hypothetical protein
MNRKDLLQSIAAWRAANPDYKLEAPKNPLERWQEKDTRASAIRAMCWRCMGGTLDYGGGVRAEIRNCSSGPKSRVPCPLWAWRPYQAVKNVEKTSRE